MVLIVGWVVDKTVCRKIREIVDNGQLTMDNGRGEVAGAGLKLFTFGTVVVAVLSGLFRCKIFTKNFTK
jgi:hypothetical protein